MTIKLLILAQDAGAEILPSIPNLHLITEKSYRDNTGFDLDPDTPGYGAIIVEKIATTVRAWKSARPLAVVLDMRYHTAIDRIPHDLSCLVYDGSKSRRLAYNTRYKTDITIENANEISRLTDTIEVLN